MYSPMVQYRGVRSAQPQMTYGMQPVRVAQHPIAYGPPRLAPVARGTPAQPLRAEVIRSPTPAHRVVRQFHPVDVLATPALAHREYRPSEIPQPLAYRPPELPQAPAVYRPLEMPQTPTLVHREVIRTPAMQHREVVRTPAVQHREVLRTPAVEHREVLRTPALQHREVMRTPGIQHREVCVTADVQRIVQALASPALPCRSVRPSEAVPVPVLSSSYPPQAAQTAPPAPAGSALGALQTFGSPLCAFEKEAKQRSAAMVQPEWSAAQIAQRICDDMVAKGTLQSKPAFVRQDREKKWVALFEACELDGQRICSCTDPSALDVLIRKKTQGEVWVDNLIASLVSLMPEEVRESRTRCGMRVTVNRMNGDPVQVELSRPCLVRQARAKLAKVFACEETRVALFAGSQVLADRDHAHPEMSMVLMAPKASEEDQEESESFQAFLEEMKAIFGDIEEMGLEDLTLLLHAVQTAIEDRDENRDNDDWQGALVLD
eukprot:s3221_g3.t1